MKTQNKKLLTLMLAGLCAVSLGVSVAVANASADEATTVTPSTYAISSVFSGTGTVGAKGAEGADKTVAFTLGHDQNVSMKRDLAFKWYEETGAKYLTIQFAFEDLNFKSVTFQVESASSIATKNKKTTNSVKFTVKDGKVYAAVVHGAGDEAKEGDLVETAITAGSEVTLALAEGEKFDTFAVNVNENKIGEFINVGANYSDYDFVVSAKTKEEKTTATEDAKAEEETDVKTVILLQEINGQRFDNVKDDKITDTAAPVLVVNEDVNGFQIGTAFSLSYEKIDVLQTTSLTESKKY